MKQEVEGLCCLSFVFLQDADMSVQVHLRLMVNLGPERRLAW